MDRLIIVSSSSYNLFHFQMINHVCFFVPSKTAAMYAIYRDDDDDQS